MSRVIKPADCLNRFLRSDDDDPHPLEKLRRYKGDKIVDNTWESVADKWYETASPEKLDEDASTYVLHVVHCKTEGGKRITFLRKDTLYGTAFPSSQTITEFDIGQNPNLPPITCVDESQLSLKIDVNILTITQKGFTDSVVAHKGQITELSTINDGKNQSTLKVDDFNGLQILFPLKPNTTAPSSKEEQETPRQVADNYFCFLYFESSPGNEWKRDIFHRKPLEKYLLENPDSGLRAAFERVTTDDEKIKLIGKLPLQPDDMFKLCTELLGSEKSAAEIELSYEDELKEDSFFIPSLHRNPDMEGWCYTGEGTRFLRQGPNIQDCEAFNPEYVTHVITMEIFPTSGKCKKTHMIYTREKTPWGPLCEQVSLGTADNSASNNHLQVGGTCDDQGQEPKQPFGIGDVHVVLRFMPNGDVKVSLGQLNCYAVLSVRAKCFFLDPKTQPTIIIPKDLLCVSRVFFPVDDLGMWKETPELVFLSFWPSSREDSPYDPETPSAAVYGGEDDPSFRPWAKIPYKAGRLHEMKRPPPESFHSQPMKIKLNELFPEAASSPESYVNVQLFHYVLNRIKALEERVASETREKRKKAIQEELVQLKKTNIELSNMRIMYTSQDSFLTNVIEAFSTDLDLACFIRDLLKNEDLSIQDQSTALEMYTHIREFQQRTVSSPVSRHTPLPPSKLSDVHPDRISKHERLEEKQAVRGGYKRRAEPPSSDFEPNKELVKYDTVWDPRHLGIFRPLDACHKKHERTMLKVRDTLSKLPKEQYDERALEAFNYGYEWHYGGQHHFEPSKMTIDSEGGITWNLRELSKGWRDFLLDKQSKAKRVSDASSTTTSTLAKRRRIEPTEKRDAVPTRIHCMQKIVTMIQGPLKGKVTYVDAAHVPDDTKAMLDQNVVYIRTDGNPVVYSDEDAPYQHTPLALRVPDEC